MSIKRTKRNEAIVEHFKKSTSLVNTGEAFGITGERVRQIAKEYGVASKSLRKEKTQAKLDSIKDKLGVSEKLSDNDSYLIRHYLGLSYKKIKEQNLCAAILECYEAGMCRMDIERYLGISYRTASKYLELEKMPKGCLRGLEAKERDAKLYADWKKNKDLNVIAKQYDMTYENAFYCIKRHLYNDCYTKKKIK